MDFLKSIFNTGQYTLNSSGPNSSEPNKSTCVLDQGRELLNNQYKREVSFMSNTQLLEKDSSIEGFTSDHTLSSTFDKNINRYDKEYPDLIADARAYTKKTDRNAEINRHFKEHVDLLYDIKADKEGCYKSVSSGNGKSVSSGNGKSVSSGNGKSVSASSLIYQPNMQDVSEDTCKHRALDEGYAGFSIKKGANGQLGCYLTNDIQGEKKGDIAIKPMISYSFKNNKDANMGGLLMNGQVGTYKNNMDTNLITDLESCSKDNSLINKKSIVATYGGNCRKQ
jgi:hypothetical protein